MSKFKFKLEDPRIERSREKLFKFPEIRGLLTKDTTRELGTLRFRGCSGGHVLFDIEGDYHKIMDRIHSHGGSEYYDNFQIPLDNILNFKDENPNIKLVNFEPVFEPFWKIKKQDKAYKVQWNGITNPNGYTKGLSKEQENLMRIPGLEYKRDHYTVPLSEGWRLYFIHPEIKSRLCEWVNPEDQIDIKKEFETRLRVKTIHTAEDSDCDVEFPNSPDFKVRPHQKVAFEFAELVNRKAIIAYGTGTGKTAIGIGDAIRSNAERVLFVVPGQLRLNWRKHILTHTGCEPTILAGRAPTKEDFKYLMTKHPRWVIINYEILRSAVYDTEKDKREKINARYPWVELLNLYHPDYIIVDECHYAKNPSAHQSKAVRSLGHEETYKMALSGTPIMNRHGELWSMLNWLHPEQFKYYETFITQYGSGRSISDYDARQLRTLLETILIKRTRHDISKNLPPVNRIVETFEMSNRAREIYNRILEGIYKELAEFDHKGIGGELRRFDHILPKLNAMIKVCAADKVDHTVNRAIEIADANEEENWNKVLIFTHFKGTCNTIARKLGAEALSFVRRTNAGFVTEDMEERMELVDQFQNDPSKKFLICTEKSAREGLDITAAGVIIFNDLFWTPAAHLQCEGRAFYRESDMHGGDSMYFQFENSIEEWIVELQGVKENTIEKVIEGKGFEYSITSQIVERLRDMFNKRMGK